MAKKYLLCSPFFIPLEIWGICVVCNGRQDISTNSIIMSCRLTQLDHTLDNRLKIMHNNTLLKKLTILEDTLV